ncbi:class I SAM-dependent methyltransferase [Oxalobacteraceae bacterium CAVE-383]|nr:class I SAM-dependent methyltransferase [Oxalobacteraceae bacterium CAVE-383]
MLHTDPAAYFTARAETYHDVYERPEQREELLLLQEKVAELMDGHAVLEVGCGTGYWTRQLAEVADSVTAVDSNDAMLAVARRTPDERIEWVQGNACDLPVSDAYTACFGGFWWSHLPRERQSAWLGGLQKKLGKDTLLVLIDNNYVEGSSTPIAHTDAEGNTYQIRALAGERYDVMKNFPTDSALRKRFADHAREIRIKRMEHFWILSCRLK